MFTLSLDIDEVEAFGRRYPAEVGDLQRELDEVPYEAAKAGIEEMQAHHPYTDRTYQLTETARARDVGAGEAEMHWPKPYAVFVEAKEEFAFTPVAIARAEASLERGVERALDHFLARLGR